MTYGFHFCVFEKWETVKFYYEDGQSYTTCEPDVECWSIFPDGKFWYMRDSDRERFGGECEGTFDSSLYEDYVSQMKEYKTDWMKGLSYDRDTMNFTQDQCYVIYKMKKMDTWSVSIFFCVLM